MFEYLYEWLRNLSFYLILVTAVLHILPGNSYKKYIQFFTGLVLIGMLLTPILKLFGGEIRINDAYESFYTDLENNANYFEAERMEEESHKNVEIEVEEIVIGP